jgi:ribosomal protein S18 acetylase RimI-like enzyme
MAGILTDTSAAGMVEAIESTLDACLLLLASTPRGETRSDGGISIGITGIPDSDFNGVYRTRLDPGLPEAAIEARITDVVADLRFRAIPFGWWVMPTDRPSDLRARLAAHGFTSQGERPAMAVDLDRPRTPPLTPADLAIEESADVDGLREHTRLMAIGFGMPPDLETAFRELLQELPYGPGTPMRYFLARERGQPVGTSLLILAGGAAGIFNVITAPEARGRGVGAAVTDVALRTAREAGQRIAVLESSRLGYHAYQRLGFTEYGKVGHFEWVATPTTTAPASPSVLRSFWRRLFARK